MKNALADKEAALRESEIKLASVNQKHKDLQDELEGLIKFLKSYLGCFMRPGYPRCEKQLPFKATSSSEAEILNYLRDLTGQIENSKRQLEERNRQLNERLRETEIELAGQTENLKAAKDLPFIFGYKVATQQQERWELTRSQLRDEEDTLLSYVNEGKRKEL